MSPKTKNPQKEVKTVSHGMHYATITALMISNLTVLGLGAVLSNQLLGNGLGYFAQVDEQSKLEQTMNRARVFEQGPSFQSLMNVQVPPAIQNAFSLGWFAGKEFIVDWVAHNSNPVQVPVKVLVLPASFMQVAAMSAPLAVSAKTIAEIPDGSAISFAYQWGFAKGISLYNTQVAPPLTKQDLAAINGGLSDAVLNQQGFIASIARDATAQHCEGLTWYPDTSTLPYCRASFPLQFNIAGDTSDSCCGVSMTFASS